MAFWDTEETIASFPKNERGEEIVVKSVTKGVRSFVDVRTFYPGKAGELLPGKGLSIPEDLADAVANSILGRTK